MDNVVQDPEWAYFFSWYRDVCKRNVIIDRSDFYREREEARQRHMRVMGKARHDEAIQWK